MHDELHDVHRRMGYAIANLQAGLAAARRLAATLEGDTAASLRWTLDRADHDLAAVDSLHNEWDKAMITMDRVSLPDSALAKD